MTSLQAVLWDMDGTLVDSEILWDKAIYSTMEELGSPLSPANRAQTIGLSMPDLIIALHSFSTLPDTVDAKKSIEDGINSKMIELYQTELAWRPGAQELMQELSAAGVPQALVTNTQRFLTDEALRKIGTQHFHASVCGDEVAQGKPAPDPYVKAAQLLGVAPSDCLVLEDSVTGIAAGVSAGCHVIGIPSENPLKEGDGYVVWDSLDGVSVSDLGVYSATHGQE